MRKEYTTESALIAVQNKCNAMNYTLLKFDYKNQVSKLQLQCNVHTDIIWSPSFHSFVKLSSKCSKCTNRYTKTESEISYEINKKCEILNYEFIQFDSGSFKNVKQKILLKCNMDKYEWSPSIDNFLTKESRCPKCMHSLRVNIEDFNANLLNRTIKNNHKFLNIIGNFKHGMTSIKLECNICNNMWKTSYNSYMAQPSSKCRKCINKQKLTETEAVNIIINKCTLRNYTYIKFKDDKYVNNKSKIMLICNKHKHIWSLTYYNFINSDNGCPLCKESKGELTIRTYLENSNIAFIRQKQFDKCTHINNLSYDFYLPDYNMCIEFDGRQHFAAYKYFGGDDAFKKIKLRDKIKDEYCNLNNIRLLRINYKQNIIDILKNNLI